MLIDFIIAFRICLGEEEDTKKEADPVDRFLGAEGGQDEELGNDSVGGGAGEEVVPDKPFRSKIMALITATTQTTTKDNMEQMQEAMVMPKPRIFSGPDNARQRQVVEAFQWGWDAYKRYAWGHDELKPLSRSYKEWFQIGLTLVDSIDTMYIMGLTKGEFYPVFSRLIDCLIDGCTGCLNV